MRFRILHKCLWLIIFKKLPFSKHNDFVTFNDGLESVGNRDDCAFSEFFLDKGLDLLLRDQIYVGSGFVEKDDLVLSQNGSAYTNQLFLAT